ncbi:Fic family protein [Mucilaginibacter sp. JRF]|uniref:Fic family protein n=1 Tax=Mucilaginibacter sp. JRF TaxID=2780088 RepID=UPI001882FB4E|nr:Fic family protein [Mucilaginibacter sp. JRF]MBE9586310.1 Fic family protein [Mucilaginibacter sp. JRF]
MNLKLEQEYSKADLLKEIDVLKERIDAQRPLPVDVEGRVMQKLRLDWNYNSNAIEGNKLNYGETTALLMHGITAKGKPLKDHLDIQGHNDAIDFLLSVIKDSRPLTENDIRQLHEIILVQAYEVDAQTADGQPTKKRIEIGAYKTQPNHVQTATGQTHYYATPEETPAKMQELMQWYAAASADKNIHPIVVAALFHHKFVAIHPFDDGNGRVSRILMNLVLMKNDYPPAVIKNDNKQSYYALLSQADVGDSWPFIEYIAELVQSSLELYTKAINGGDIDEDEDIDKKLALFQIEIKTQSHFGYEQTIIKEQEIILDVIEVLVKICQKNDMFKDVFSEIKPTIFITYYQSKKSDAYSKPLIRDLNHIAELFVDDNINYIKKSIKDLRENFSDLRFSCAYKKFKNSRSMFNVDMHVDLIFNDHRYVLALNENEILSKLYNEEITQKEKRMIVSSFFDEFIKQFRYERQSPK